MTAKPRDIGPTMTDLEEAVVRLQALASRSGCEVPPREATLASALLAELERLKAAYLNLVAVVRETDERATKEYTLHGRVLIGVELSPGDWQAVLDAAGVK